jgi:hypothetical protein
MICEISDCRVTETGTGSFRNMQSPFNNLRLFNNSVFGCLAALTYLDPRLRGDDRRLALSSFPRKRESSA